MSEKEITGDVHPPYRRKNGYKELEQKLEEHATYLEDRLRRFFTKALYAFAVLGVTSAGALLGFGVVLDQQGDVSNDIQIQRYEAIYENCIQQNQRHDNAVAKAEGILPKESREVVILLVNELQPYVEDCEKQARSRVQGNRDVE